MVIVSSLLVLYSCEKNSTENGPTTTDREKFLGDWQGSSTGSSGNSLNWNMTISASNSAPDQILMYNFDAYTMVVATVTGNSITIPGAPLNVFAGDTVTGSGTYNNNNTLSFNFTIKDGQIPDYRTGSAHK